MRGPFEGLRSCGSLECYGVLEKISSKYAQCSLLESHGVGTLGSGHSCLSRPGSGPGVESQAVLLYPGTTGEPFLGLLTAQEAALTPLSF